MDTDRSIDPFAPPGQAGQAEQAEQAQQTAPLPPRAAPHPRRSIGRRTHLIGAGSAVLVVVLGLGAAAAFGSTTASGPSSPVFAGASHDRSPSPAPTPSDDAGAPSPTTSTFDSAVPDPTPLPVQPTPTSTTSYVSQLQPGACIQDAITDNGLISEVTVVPCAKPHSIEVYTSFDLTGNAFPGTATVRRQSEKGCETRFRAFDGRSAAATGLQLSDLTPTATSWSDTDKRVLCLVAEPKDKKRTGSLRNSRE